MEKVKRPATAKLIALELKHEIANQIMVIRHLEKAGFSEAARPQRGLLAIYEALFEVASRMLPEQANRGDACDG